MNQMTEISHIAGKVREGESLFSRVNNGESGFDTLLGMIGLLLKGDGAGGNNPDISRLPILESLLSGNNKAVSGEEQDNVNSQGDIFKNNPESRPVMETGGDVFKNRETDNSVNTGYKIKPCRGNFNNRDNRDPGTKRIDPEADNAVRNSGVSDLFFPERGHSGLIREGRQHVSPHGKDGLTGAKLSSGGQAGFIPEENIDSGPAVKSLFSAGLAESITVDELLDSRGEDLKLRGNFPGVDKPGLEQNQPDRSSFLQNPPERKIPDGYGGRVAGVEEMPVEDDIWGEKRILKEDVRISSNHSEMRDSEMDPDSAFKPWADGRKNMNACMGERNRQQNFMEIRRGGNSFNPGVKTEEELTKISFNLKEQNGSGRGAGDFHGSPESGWGMEMEMVKEPAVPGGEMPGEKIRKNIIRSVRDSVVDEIKVMRDRGRSEHEVRLKLHPPRMGEVRVRVSMEGENLRVSLLVDSDTVRQVMENGSERLAQAVSREGFILEDLDVSTGQWGGRDEWEGMDEDFGGFSGESTGKPQSGKMNINQISRSDRINIFA